MRILLTNDDGIHAPGFALLEEVVAQFSDDVTVCCPAEEQSGAGHSLTLHMPVRLQEHGPRRYAVTGTPTDSVNLALRTLFPDGPPDLVISGINAGENLADDVTYSGTISAAMEGALANIPAIALSQVMRDSGNSFDAACGWAAKALGPLIELAVAGATARRTVINVNFPPLPADQVKGIRVVRQGFHDYSRGAIVQNIDPRGRTYYWFGLESIEQTPDHGTDLEAINEGFIAVTPLQLDLTHHASLATLAERFAQ